MNLSSISNNSSPNYLQPAASSSGTPQSSLFAQMLKNSAGSTQASGAPKSTGSSNPNQLLTQLLPSFQSSGVQNEAQSLDPMSML